MVPLDLLTPNGRQRQNGILSLILTHSLAKMRTASLFRVKFSPITVSNCRWGFLPLRTLSVLRFYWSRFPVCTPFFVGHVTCSVRFCRSVLIGSILSTPFHFLFRFFYPPFILLTPFCFPSVLFVHRCSTCVCHYSVFFSLRFVCIIFCFHHASPLLIFILFSHHSAFFSV